MREDTSGSMQSDNWEDDDDKMCSLCHQGQVPVQVEDISDVQKVIEFGSHYNFGFVVKISRHDILIWMYKLKNLTIHESFGRCVRLVIPAMTAVGGVSHSAAGAGNVRGRHIRRIRTSQNATLSLRPPNLV
ncbi:hypothetical protein M758_UG021500 [Ceratodon purpureus]|nr:hypothetical protein M758_UG021500 [Ceratodon purpureus]